MVNIQKRRRTFFGIVAIIYFVILVIFCITRFNLIMLLLGRPLHHQEGVNLIPFQSIIVGFKKYGKLSWDIFENTLMYIPLGVISCFYLKHFSYIKKGMFCFFVPIVVEISQFVLKTGSFDIDDIIVNTLGSIIGIAICKIIWVLCKKQDIPVNDTISIATSIFPPFLFIYVVDFFALSFQFSLWHVILIVVYFYFCHKFLLSDLNKKQCAFYYGTVVIISLWFFLFFMSPTLMKMIRRMIG